MGLLSVEVQAEAEVDSLVSTARLAVTAFGLTGQAPQETVELVKDLVLLPGGEVPVDGFPWGEVVRQVPRQGIPVRST